MGSVYIRRLTQVPTKKENLSVKIFYVDIYIPANSSANLCVNSRNVRNTSLKYIESPSLINELLVLHLEYL